MTRGFSDEYGVGRVEELVEGLGERISVELFKALGVMFAVVGEFIYSYLQGFGS